MNLSGKVAVVTGASRGLGLELGRCFLARGAKVVLSSRSAADATKAARGLGEGALGVPCDVRRKGDVDQLMARTLESFGAVDVWVNNAGQSAPYGPTSDVPVETFLGSTETAIHGSYYGTMAALRHMLPRRAGAVVNMLGRGETSPVPKQNAYGASKAWVRNFTLALAKETRGTGVAVLAFQPGLMDTTMVLEPQALAGHEAELAPLATVLRMWGEPPRVPAESLVRAIEAGRSGRAAAHAPWWMLLGPFRALLRPRVVLTPRVIEPPSAPGA